ncbi:alpha-1-antitrypsin-like [Discoglossus pictus]
MKAVLFLCVSVALFISNAYGDHNGHDPSHDNDHHDHRHNHKNHKEGHHHHPHGKGKHHHFNESVAYYKVAPANLEFAFELFHQVASEKPSKNIFFSPVSISTAFAMLSLGAKARTHNQILEGLGFNISERSEQDIHDGFQHLFHTLNDEDSELKLNSGNALFVEKNLELRKKFLDDVKKYYESEVHSTDFQNSEEAKSQINSFVEKKTNGKIKDLLDSVSQDAALILINFMVFRGQWVKPFDEEYTKECNFTVDENTVVKVPMMYETGHYNVVFDNKLGCKVVELPYKGNASAWFILPDKGKFKQVEDAFHISTLKNWKKAMSSQVIELRIPKFSISTNLDLKATLSKMGVTDVFSNQADLSGITEATNLKVSTAVHKAVLNVDEKGTEAAVATAVEAIPMSIPPSVELDHPFLLAIQHKLTNSFLFLGKVINPTE